MLLVESTKTKTFSPDICFSAYYLVTVNIATSRGNETTTPHSGLSETNVEVLRIRQAASSLSYPSLYTVGPTSRTQVFGAPSLALLPLV